jgi:thymidine kinase
MEESVIKDGPQLILLIGPMKSGKSGALFSYFGPLGFSDISWTAYMPSRNTRDNTIWSRMGKGGIKFDQSKVNKVETLEDALKSKDRVIGIDEIHMFEPSQAKIIGELLLQGKDVIAAGLDMDYRGVVYEIITKLMMLGPDEIISHQAVCDVCKQWNAHFTQILHNGIPVLEGLPSIIPDDKTHEYEYQSRCREHFVKK